MAKHRRQRDQSHSDDGSTDNSGRCCEQRSDENYRYAQTPGNRAKQLSHGDQKIFCDLRALEHDPHEDKKRNRDQGVPFNIPIQAPKIGHSRRQPFDGSSFQKIRTDIAFHQIAKERCQPEGDHRRAR